MLMMSPSVTDTGNVHHGVQHWGRAGKTLQARCVQWLMWPRRVPYLCSQSALEGIFLGFLGFLAGLRPT